MALIFLTIVNKAIGINFTADIQEEKRKEITRLFSIAFDFISRTSGLNNRCSLPLQLNRFYFINMGVDQKSKNMVYETFHSYMNQIGRQEEEKTNQFIPERLCVYLDHVKSDADDIISAIANFYDNLNINRIKGDAFLWYKTILFYARNNMVDRIVPSIYSYLRSFFELSNKEELNEKEMINRNIEMLRNLLGLAISIPENQYSRIWRYNVFAWLVYVAIETITNENRESVKSIFQEAFTVFNNVTNEKQKLLENFIEFLYIFGTHEEYEEAVDMCLKQDMISMKAMKNVNLAIQLAKANPLLKAIISKVLIRDYIFINDILERYISNIDPKLRSDVFESSLNILQGNTILAIRWSSHELSQGNYTVAEHILSRLVNIKPQDLKLWSFLIKVNHLLVQKKKRKAFQRNIDTIFDQMIEENPYIRVKTLNDFLEDEAS